MRTHVTDSFELHLLDCQYFNICKFYEPDRCNYSSSCETRQCLRSTLENTVSFACMKFQVDLIIHNEKK